LIVARLCRILLPALPLFCGEAYADPRPIDENLTFPCAFLGDCPVRKVPGGPDRAVQPFAGSIGRPCAWRERPTPQGPRKVRACY
jgi:hypothetical protein